MKDNELQFDRKSHVLYTICGDQDPYVKEHPEYRDEAGFRRNK